MRFIKPALFIAAGKNSLKKLILPTVDDILVVEQEPD